MTAKRPSGVHDKLMRAAGPRPTSAPAAAGAPAPAPAAEGRKAKVQQSVNWDRELLEYSRDAVIRLSRSHPEAGITSLAALVNTAVREKLTTLEAQYNGGKPFVL